MTKKFPILKKTKRKMINGLFVNDSNKNKKNIFNIHRGQKRMRLIISSEMRMKKS